MAAQLSYLFGKIVDTTFGRSLAGMRVEVGLSTGGSFRSFASATTDSNGSFKVSLQAAPTKAGPYVFQVFDRKRKLQITAGGTWTGRPGEKAEAVVRVKTVDAKVHPDELLLGGDSSSLASGQSVRGVVRRPSGAVYDGMAVTTKAYAVQVGAVPSQLGSASSVGADGTYIITYASAPPPKRVVVKAYTGSEPNLVLVGASEMVSKPSDHERVDVVLEDATLRGDPEFAVVNAATGPLYGLALSTIDGDALVAAQDELDLGLDVLADYVAARELAARYGAGTDQDWIQSIFGLLRQGFPSSAARLTTMGTSDIVAALGKAADAHVVAQSIATNASNFALWLRGEAKRALAVNSTTPASIGALISAAVTGDANKKKKFLELQETYEGDADGFWGAVSKDTDLSGAASALQQSVEVGLVAMNHAPFLAALGGNVSTIVELSDGALDTLITTTGTPAGVVAGAGDADANVAFRKLIREQVERAHPSLVLHKSLRGETDTKYLSAAAQTYIADSKNKGFDFEVTVDSAIDTDVKAELKKMQRLYRIAPETKRYGAVQRGLIDKGHTSAATIGNLTWKAFWRKHNSPTDADTVAALREIYRRSRHQAGLTHALMTLHHPQLQEPRIAAFGALPRPEDSTGDADYKDLFGGLSFCACDDCQSVLSPSAYYVDLVDWLKQQGTSPTHWDALKSASPRRRPDLATLKLSCDNANTAIPYIDLVNEVLEDAVAIANTLSLVAHDATSGTSDERFVTPEHRNGPVYSTVLSAAVHAPTLPFDLPLAETRTFLTTLGRTRLDLMRARVALDSLSPAANAVAAEQLGLNATGYELIANGSKPDYGTAPTIIPQPWRRWGYATSSGWIDNLRGADSGSLGVGSTLLPRARITIDDLRDLLHSQYVNPVASPGPRRLALTFTDECDLSTYTIAPTSGQSAVSDVDFTRMSRFLRLWRATGWSMLTLDRVVSRLGVTLAGPADGEQVNKVADLSRLTTLTGLSAEDLLPLWGPMDTFVDRSGQKRPTISLYDRTFLNPVVVPDPSPTFALNPERTELLLAALLTGVTLGQRASEICAALHVDPKELAELFVEVTSGSTLNLANLTDLYRRVALARHLGLSLAESRRLRALIETDPFSSPADAVAFLAIVDRWRDAGLSLAEVEYILSQSVDSRSLTGPSPEDVVAIAGRVRDQVRAADATADLNKEALFVALAETLEIDRATVAALNDIDFAYFGSGAAHASDVLLDAGFLDAAEVNGDPWGDLRTAATDSDAERALNTVELLAKSALLVRRFDVTTAELASWNAAVAGWPNPPGGSPELLPLAGLPAEKSSTYPTGSAVQLLFKQLLATSDLFQARKKYPGTAGWEQTIDRLYGRNATPTTLAASLAARAGFDAADIANLASTVGATQTGYTWTTAVGLRRVGAALEHVRAMGVSAETMTGWATSTWPTETESEQVIAAARARQPSMQAWISAARPVRDALREAQRDALVAYLLDPAATPTANALYEKLLLDVEMGHCALTSRLRAALSSVQLFVERVGMGLEAGLSLPADAVEQWEAMKRYRIWEAGRKVYLWPENWMEPSVRDDKTPLFKDLESMLQQGEVTDDSVEDAVVSYLEGLHEVGNLEPAGVYSEKDEDDDGETDVLHVFGRTRSTPRRHYYRQRLDGWRWSAWERIDLDIPGDHLVPVVHDRRLHLVWPVFSPQSVATGDDDHPVTESWMEIQVGWATFRNGAWSGPHVGDAVLKTERHILAQEAPADFRVTSEVDDDGNLVILVVRMTTEGAASAVTHSRDGNSNQNLRRDAEPPHTIGRFTLDSATLDVSAELNETLLADNVPPGATPDGQRLRLSKTTPGIQVPLDEQPFADASEHHTRRVLGKIGDLHSVLPNAQDAVFTTTDTFFLIGSTTSWLVEPKSVHSADAREAARQRAPWRLGTFPKHMGRYVQPPADVMPSGLTLKPTKAAPPRVRDIQRYAKRQENRRRLANAKERDPYTRTEADVDFTFTGLHHPYTARFLREVRRHGVMGLLDPSSDGSGADLIQQAISTSTFDSTYAPTRAVTQPHPLHDIDFDDEGAYAQYNWEVFLHVPLAVADALSSGQRFEEASRWFHTIFDPRNLFAGTGRPVWKVKPLATDPNELINNWASLVNTPSGSAPAPAALTMFRRFERLTAAWRDDPFNPYLVARMRHGAFQRAVVMRYLDHLIAWGDGLFRQDTVESINEATQLYVLAAKLLGDKPTVLSKSQPPAAQAYGDLAAPHEQHIRVEQRLTRFAGRANHSERAALPAISHLDYFGVPPNPKLLGYWDTVADRLFKVRHCMNLQGQVRQLPLFDPPIDPGLLVRARAAGVDLATALWGMGSTLPHFRFSYMIQRAQALAGSVRTLGSALLQAIEKKDAEALSLLRQGQEMRLLQLVRDQKVEQVQQSRQSRAAADRTLALAKGREEYYSDLLDKGLSPGENAQIALIVGSEALQLASAGIRTFGATAVNVPDAKVGTLGVVPVALVDLPGGRKLKEGAEMAAGALSALSGLANTAASVTGIVAGYARRKQEWKQQLSQAKIEIAQAERQLAAADLAIAITELELKNHDRQTANARELDAYMRTKFSNVQLYTWMVGQLSALHFQTYQLAFDTAKQAEKCFSHEVALDPATVSYVRYGAWDSLKKGLLAGERLQADLERMQAAYDVQDEREFEITKQVSLMDLDPVAIIALQEEGMCKFDVPECWFDLDHIGHNFRRLQAVAVSVPSVAGPIAGLSAELELDASDVRYGGDTTDTASYAAHKDGVRSIDENDSTSSVIATSTGSDDGGVFSLSFQDPKYLPFERQGAVSSWSLRLSGNGSDGGRPTFDWRSIADVILNLRYTARSASALKTKAAGALTGSLNALATATDALEATTGLTRVFSAVKNYPEAWRSFVLPDGAPSTTTLTIPFSDKDLPYGLRDGAKVKCIELLMIAGGTTLGVASVAVGTTTMTTGGAITIGGGTPPTKRFGLPRAVTPVLTAGEPSPGSIAITASLTDVQNVGLALQDILVVVYYKVG